MGLNVCFADSFLSQDLSLLNDLSENGVLGQVEEARYCIVIKTDESFWGSHSERPITFTNSRSEIVKRIVDMLEASSFPVIAIKVYQPVIDYQFLDNVLLFKGSQDLLKGNRVKKIAVLITQIGLFSQQDLRKQLPELVRDKLIEKGNVKETVAKLRKVANNERILCDQGEHIDNRGSPGEPSVVDDA